MADNNETNTIPIFNSKSKDAIFKLAKSNQFEIKMTYFLFFCMKTMQSTSEFITPNVKQTIFYFIYFFKTKIWFFKYLSSKDRIHKTFLSKTMSLQECLSDLQFFIQNKLLGYIDLDSTYGEVNPLIQNILREQNFIDALVLLLLKMFPKFENLRDVHF